jgi:hypothetical protein
MTKRKKQGSPPAPKRRYLIPVSKLSVIAHQFFMLKPNETIILNRLKELYGESFDAGYQRRVSDNKYFNAKRDARIKVSFDSVYRSIEDTIHGGVVEKINQKNN